MYNILIILSRGILKFMENSQLQIGDKIREIRKAKKITINEVAKKTGYTSSFISQLERGRTTASIGSLQKITHSLGLNLSTLFEKENENNPNSNGEYPVIIRKSERKKLHYPEPVNAVDYLLTGLGGHLQIILGEIKPGGSSGELYSHDSEEECIIVLQGKVEVTIGEESYILHENETITFSSRIPHGWKNIGTDVLKLLWVITPPSF